jgi:uncharacterized protein
MKLQQCMTPIACPRVSPGGSSRLSAASALNNAGIDVRVFDAGHHLEERSDFKSDDVAIGIGGAGLFSDGKFSFYPSNSTAFKVQNIKTLKASYNWLVMKLSNAGIKTEPFPDLAQNSYTDSYNNLKQYVSNGSNYTQRKKLIESIVYQFKENIQPDARVISIDKPNNVYTLTYLDNSGQLIEEGGFNGIILATGRFGTLQLIDGGISQPIKFTPVRYEFGIRLEWNATIELPQDGIQTDIKRLWHLNGLNYRTFCTCRDGEIWALPYNPLTAISGRADRRKSMFTNFAFLVRYCHGRFNDGEQIWHELNETLLRRRGFVFWETLDEFLCNTMNVNSPNIDVEERPWYPKDAYKKETLRPLMGERLYTDILNGFDELLSWFPELRHPSTICMFPVIEGVGYYPFIDEEFRVPRSSIWCCGDLVGKMRGLVAALLNGHYVGSLITNL